MKKHILKVWMILAISFLAMNAAGQGPTVVSLSPVNGVNGVAVDAQLSIEFDMDIRARTFTSNSENSFIRIHNENGEVYQEYWSNGGAFCERALIGYDEEENPLYSFTAINPSIISIVNNNTLQINVSGDSSPNYLNGLTYYVTIGGFAIYSVEYSTRFSGFVNNSTWRFSIENQPLPPTPDVYTPSQGATSAPTNQPISLQFDIDIQAGTGGLEIWEDGGFAAWASYDQTAFGTELAIVGNNTLSIALPQDFDEGTSYYVLIDPGFVESPENVAFDGFATNSDWSFTTEYLPLNPQTLNPSNLDTGIPRNTILDVVFDKDIEFGSGGTVEIYNGTTQAKLFNKRSSEISIVNNNALRVDLSSSALAEYATLYDVRISSDFIKRVGSETYFTGFAAGEWSFTTEAEPLEITLMAPVDGATDVPLDQSLVATFNQNIQFSEGGASVSIYSYDDEVLFETLTYEAGLSISGMELTINPTTDFAEGTRYYVIIPGGDIESTTGTPFSGVTLKDDWDFTTQNLAPSVVTYDPDGTSVVAIDKVLNLTFDRPIKLNESGIHTIRIGRNSDASTFYTYYINGLDTDELLSVSGNVLSIIPPVNFESSTQYYVEISDGAILSLADMSFPGISGTTTWTFTSVVAAAPPVIASGGYSPGTGAFEISRNPILELTFNENIVKGNSGYFKIYTSVDNEEVIAIPRTNAQVSILDNKLTVSLSNITLEYGTEYYILIDPGFVKSSTTGVDFGGIELTTEWSFTTESSPPFWVNGYPSITNQTMNDFVFNAWADVEGTYYGVVTQSSTPPTAEQISQGMNQGGTSARIAFNDVVSDVSMASTQTVLFTSETPLGGTYYLHAVYSNGSKFSAIETLTIDRIVPQILSVDPSDGLIVFPVDSPLSISFNEPVVGSDGNALTVAYFSLEKDGEPVEDVNFGFAVETVSEITTVTLKPTLALDPNTAYTLTINPVYDLNGNMGAETLINFQTDGLSTWTGAVSTAWTDPENWLGDSYVPFKSVLIQSGSTFYPEITTGTVDVHNLTIEPGAALTHTGGTLNVTGLFTLKSSVDVNASYIIKGGTPVVDGDKVRVEQVINDVYMTYLISAPTDGTTATNFGGDFPLYLFDNTTDTWPAVPSSHQMQTGFGYRMWTDDPLVYFSGEFNTGGVQVPLSYTSGKGYGWNLVGNPYAASIDWTQLDVASNSRNIENNFWIWMPTGRAYGAYSASTTIPLNIDSSIIPSNHAFLVKVVSPEESAFINFVPAAQVANSMNYLKSGKASATSYVKFAGVSGKVRDEMAVAFIDDASMGLDKYDMEKRFANQNHVLELFTNVGDMQAAINAVPLDGNYEVALGYNAMVAGDFSIEMVKDNTDNVSCVLVDKSLELEQVLRPGDRYEFSATKGKNITRFALKFSKIVTSEKDIEQPVADFSCHVFENEIFVDFDNAHNGLKFQVADVQGRILKQGSILDSSKFSVGVYEQGVYVLTFNDLNGQWYGSQKVVVY